MIATRETGRVQATGSRGFTRSTMSGSIGVSGNDGSSRSGTGSTKRLQP